MQNRKPISYIIVYVISLVMLGYILYMSVYNQIIAQSDGFFNMIIFAGILLLVFILISLVIKLMAFTPTQDISPILKYFMVFLGLCLIGLSAYLRLKYSSSVPANESVLYKTIDYINDGMLSQGGDIAPQLLYYPGEFSYALLSSFIFNILGAEPSFIITLNIVYLSLCAIFAFLVTSVVSDNICGFLAFVMVLFMPGSSFSVYSYGHELFFSAVFLLTAYLCVLLINRTFSKPAIPIIISVFAGLVGGLTIFTEPVSILIILVLTIWIIFSKKQTIVPKIVAPVLSLVSFVLLCVVKSSMMEEAFGDVFLGYISAFNPLYNNYKEEAIEFSDFLTNVGKYVDDLNSHIVNNYYFLTGNDGHTYSSIQAVWIQLGNQLIFMFLIIMCVSAVLYLLKAKYDKVTPMFSVFIAAFIAQVLNSKYSNNGLYFGFIMVVLSATTIQQMFLNHHPEVSDILIELDEKNGEIRKIETKDVEPEVSESDDEIVLKLERARALVFYGENEELFEKIKIEEKQKRYENGVATTVIATGFDEEGNYISKREQVEYFDDEDTKVENIIHEVKAIPGSRPVEVVKPVFADEVGYLDEPDDFDNKADGFDLNNNDLMNNFSIDNDFIEKTANNDDYYLDDEDSNLVNKTVAVDVDNKDNDLKDTSESVMNNDGEDNSNVKDGFVIRKKGNSSPSKTTVAPISLINSDEGSNENEPNKPETKKEKKLRIKAEKEALKANKEALKASNKSDKANKSSDKEQAKANKAKEKELTKLNAKKAKLDKILAKKGKLSDKDQKEYDSILEKLENVISSEISNEAESNNVDSINEVQPINEIKVSNSEKAKKGEHLHNPLPLPKAHVSKDMDFDFDVSEDDDFDY